MGNIAILTTRPSDAGTASGGLYIAAAPLIRAQWPGNFRTPDINRFARSQGVQASQSRFLVDMLTAQPVRMFALCNHNLSPTATVRWVVSTGADMTGTIIADTGAVAVGALTGVRKNTVTLLPFEVTGRYLTCQITDLSNPAGYVQFSRFLDGVCYQPEVNLDYGYRQGWVGFEFNDRVQQSRPMPRPGKPYRRATLKFSFQSEATAFAGDGSSYDLVTRLLPGNDTLIVLDPDEAPPIRNKRTIYGVARNLQDQDAIDFDTWGLSFEIQELT